MTIQRAIEILDPEHREHYTNVDVVNEACRLGMAALEKQIPKKPVRNEYGHFCCPLCDWCGFCEAEWGGRYIPHCENCGQAIDWEGVIT